VTTKIAKAATPEPLAQPGHLGVSLAAGGQGEVVIAEVEPESPAAAAGLRPGDVIRKAAGFVPATADALRDLLRGKGPGEALLLEVLRQNESREITATLTAPSRVVAADKPPATGGKGSFDTRNLGAWRKPVYRLAVVTIEYSDMKHNDAIGVKDWEASLFSRGTYTNKSVTGQTVYGSLNDYYEEQSYKNLRVEGKVFPWVQVSKKRTDYVQAGVAKTALLTEAFDRVLERDGKDALKDFDGVFILFAGGRVANVARGSLYWPHRSSFSHQGKRWPYFICPEGGGQMANISVFCHEFGHMLGLPDLYARPENPGSEGVGAWCAMSNQAGNGRPQHFCAWSKERLGWVQPALIDPGVKQKLILAPIQQSSKECYKVLVRPDASEYFLLENRVQKGFDASLPAPGLLIWRVVRGRPILEESHGVTGPAGPRVFASAVPFPSPANDSFTPYTAPSSRAQLGGGAPVHITNIRKLLDGRITFYIGYEFY
jgi:M6 family metalloprotease-like protein